MNVCQEWIEKALKDPSLDNIKRLDQFAAPVCSSFEVRMTMLTNGLLECGIQLLQLPNLAPKAVSLVWGWFWIFVTMDSLDDPRERGPGSTSDVCRQLGVFLLCQRELKSTDKGEMYCLKFLDWCLQDESLIPLLLSLSLHVEVLRRIQNGVWINIGLLVLRSFASLESARPVLRQAGALDVLPPFLDGLTLDDDTSPSRGYLACSILIRLAGNDETGMYPQVFRGNPKVVQLVSQVLRSTLENTARSSWNSPHAFTQEFLILASSDANKPLLVSVIPLLLQSVQLRGEFNSEMVLDVVHILLLLSFDPLCRRSLVNDIGENAVKLALEAHIANHLAAKDVYSKFMGAVFPSSLLTKTTTPAATKPSKFRFNLFASHNKDSTTETIVPVSSPANKHVMLSYNWASKPLVLHIHTALEKQYKMSTWIDEVNMGSNLNDSMAQAVDQASCLVAFITRKYKESGNCRLELEYACRSHV